MAGPARLAVTDLVVRYGELVAVDGLTLCVAAGEVVALLGPNGAGKTSTVEVLEGFRHPTSGSAEVLGAPPGATPADVGVMLQGGGVYPGARPAEMVRLFAAYFDEPVDPRALLDRVGLTERAQTPWRALSGGEQQRLSLALALVGRPLVLFLDEPTAGVDVAGRRVVREIVREQREAGVAVLLCTHDLEDAERGADRVVIIDRGRVVAEGAPDELSAAGGGEIRFGAPGGLDVGALSIVLGAPVTADGVGEYVVAGPPTPERVANLTAWLAERDIPLADLRAGRHRLEDVFMRLTSTGNDT